jgi:hypothetical protein
MDEEFKSRLSADHLERLAWFEDRAGTVSPAPPPLSEKRFLVSAPKGIFKPEGWDYALSIKIMNGSPYTDGQPIPTEGGGWLLSYQQEGKDPNFFTNAALRRCIRDRIPVGVLRKADARRRPSRYEVMGLALPVYWIGGYFFLESLSPRVAWDVHSVEADLPPLSEKDRQAAIQALGIAKTATAEGVLDAVRILQATALEDLAGHSDDSSPQVSRAGSSQRSGLVALPMSRYGSPSKAMPCGKPRTTTESKVTM